MKEKDNIWHRIGERPEFFPAYLVAETENGRLCYFECDCPELIHETWSHILYNIEKRSRYPIKRWTYLQNFIAVNKALDVATERIRKWYEAFVDKPQYGAFALEFEHALQEINEIMKGVDDAKKIGIFNDF